MLSEDNWNTDRMPVAGDDLRLLSHGGPGPVFLPDTLEVNSILSRVPLVLEASLSVLAPSEFDNSLAMGSNGRLRSNAPIVFKGNNFVGGIVLEGPFGFTNNGTVFLGSKGITANFNNLNEAWLSTPNVRLSFFNNTGTLTLNNGGGVSTSSIINNSGTVLKRRGEKPGVHSVISAHYVQTAGRLEVEPGEVLTFDGPVQEFRGGSIDADGTLNLTKVHGGNVSRLFDGIAFIGGDGSLHQLRSFQLVGNVSVNFPNGPGYELSADLMLGRAPSESANFVNQACLTMNGSPKIEVADPSLRNVANFINAGGTIKAANNSNPSFEVNVRNNGAWSAQSMGIRFFENNKTLTLAGGDERITPVTGAITARLVNKDVVQLDPKGGVTTFTISTL